MDEEARLHAYLVLRHSKHLSAASFARLIQAHGTLDALLANDEDPQLAQLPDHLAHPDRSTRDKVDQERRWAEQPGHNLLTFESPDYPPALRTIASPPPLLAVRGNVQRLQQPQLAMVGSRRCSAYGEDIARWMASELADCGLGITSGLARGIDTLAHQGALAAGGYTVAVVATGQDQVYPRGNSALAEQCSASGAVVSEFPLGTPPMPAYFPQRNRIISGLSLGVLVVEASLQSGSLITARLAMEQNREVFAVPGQINRAYAEGCHQLIKSGARLVEQPGDVLSELPAEVLDGLQSNTVRTSLAYPGKQARGNSGPARIKDGRCRAILRVLTREDLAFEVLQARCQLPTDTLSACLLQLEIQGLVCQREGRLGVPD